MEKQDLEHKAEIMKRVFLLGSERSGTNLLRGLLGRHKDISAPPPIHLLDQLYKRPVWDALRDRDIHRELMEKIQTYVNHEFSNWDLTIPESLKDPSKMPTSHIEVMDNVYTLKAASDGKSCYFCKDNHLHNYAIAIREAFPDSAFIYIYRDPRDQVASWMKTPFHLHTPYQAAKKWAAEQHACLALSRFYNVRVYPVAYEELIEKPNRIIERILDFAGLPSHDTENAPKDIEIESKRHKLWQNISKPVNKNNRGAYRTTLTDRQVHIVETLCQKQMIELGYTPETHCDYNFGSAALWQIKELLRESLSKRRSKAQTASDFEVIRSKTRLAKELFGKSQGQEG